ncbi:MAG: class I SAM-dependent methyltransferase [Proteobacteria bacterium]|nr:class I SAM-dependent methyltransferase [Pseudomonadota bacterium]
MRFFPIVLAALVAAPAIAQTPSAALKQAVAAPTRTEANKARDQYRHPAETLAFFGVKPTDTVVEIWPGGGWYTEILGPYLAKGGKLILANPKGNFGKTISAKLESDPAVYGKVEKAAFPATVLGGTGVAPGTADVVLTFRNVHNWREGEMTEPKADYSLAAFKEIYAMLKPGGVLGIEDHRLPEKADVKREEDSGYLKVSTVRRLAEQAGFKFAGSSEVNANPKDTADWPDGVWTLPPTYTKGETDRAKYQAIGESDRMTLKFVKPAK